MDAAAVAEIRVAPQQVLFHRTIGALAEPVSYATALQHVETIRTAAMSFFQDHTKLVPKSPMLMPAPPPDGDGDFAIGDDLEPADAREDNDSDSTQ